jgi:hypothetical protein
VNTVDDKRRLIDVLQIGEAGTAGLLPLTKRGHLRRGVWSGWCVEVVSPWCKPLDERFASSLARRRLFNKAEAASSYSFSTRPGAFFERRWWYDQIVFDTSRRLPA